VPTLFPPPSDACQDPWSAIPCIVVISAASRLSTFLNHRQQLLSLQLQVHLQCNDAFYYDRKATSIA